MEWLEALDIGELANTECVEEDGVQNHNDINH